MAGSMRRPAVRFIMTAARSLCGGPVFRTIPWWGLPDRPATKRAKTVRAAVMRRVARFITTAERSRFQMRSSFRIWPPAVLAEKVARVGTLVLDRMADLAVPADRP